MAAALSWRDSRTCLSPTRFAPSAKTARDEGFAEIADWFETLAKAEKSHAGRFGKAADTLR